jgi:hypothetical protein
METGKLAEFIEAVKDGKVPFGSFLIIEQFDRLSRANVNVALRLLMDLIEAGIVVVTLVDEKEWTKNSLSDLADLFTAIIRQANGSLGAKEEASGGRNCYTNCDERSASMAASKRRENKI